MFVSGNLIFLIALHGCVPTNGRVMQYSYIPNPIQYPYIQQQQWQQQPFYIPLQPSYQNTKYQNPTVSIPNNMPSYIPRPPDVIPVAPPKGVRESAEPSTTISKTYYSCYPKDSPFTSSSIPAFIIADTDNSLATPPTSTPSTTKQPCNPNTITSTTTKNPCITTTTTPKPNTTSTLKPNCVTTTTSSPSTHQPSISTTASTPTTQKPPDVPGNNNLSDAGSGSCSVIEIISDAKQKINNLVTNTMDTRNHQIAQIVRNSLTKGNSDTICNQATSSTPLHYTTASLSIQSGTSQLARKCMGDLYEPSDAIDQTVERVEKYLGTIPLARAFLDLNFKLDLGFGDFLRSQLHSACNEVNTCHAKVVNPTTPIESGVPENFVTSSCNSFKSSYTKMVDEVESLISKLLKDHSSASNNITSILEAKIRCTINKSICTIQELLQDKAAGNWSGIVSHTHGWIHHFQNNRIQGEKEVIAQVLAKVLRQRDNLKSFLQNEQHLINSHMNNVVQTKAQKCAQCEYSSRLSTLKKNLFDKLLVKLNFLHGGIWGRSLTIGITTPINEFFGRLSEGHNKFQASFSDGATVNKLVDGACRPYMDQIETHQANLLQEMETYSKDTCNSQVADIDQTLPHKTTVGSVLLESFKKSLGCNVTCNGTTPTQTLPPPTSQTLPAEENLSPGKKPVTLIPCKEGECHKRFAIVEIVQPGPMVSGGSKYFSGSDGNVYQYASTDGLYPNGPFVGKVIYQWEQ